MMKIIVKEINNDNDPELLIYLKTNDNISISCELITGVENKLNYIDKLQKENNLTLPVINVSYNEYKKNI